LSWRKDDGERFCLAGRAVICTNDNMLENDDKRLAHLWAPWRMGYIVASKAEAPADPCFICRGLREADDRANLVALRLPRSVVFLNRYPYNNGHLLIAPNAHKASLHELDDGEALEMQQTIARLTKAMDAFMQPDGYNIGLNLGKAAGAGLPGHVHWHLVPRWNGDTNFMPVFSDVRVIVQSLEAFFDLLVEKLTKDMHSPGA
jgi:ATP adenylyltransferase